MKVLSINDQIIEVIVNSQTNSDVVVGTLEKSLIQQEQLQYLLNELRRTLDERVESIEVRKEFGRENVELRAKIMDIERQNHILKDQLHELIQASAAQDKLRTLSSSEAVNHATSFTKSLSQIRTDALANDLIQIKQLIEGLSRSRAIGALSIVVSRPKRDIASALQRLNQLVGKLGIN